MTRLRPGWLVVAFAVVIAISGWLPWRTKTADGSGHASAIGGVVGNIAVPSKFDAGQLIVLLASTLIVAGAMAARGLSARMSSVAALVISLCIGGLTFVYYHQKIHPGMAAGYGLYIGAVATGAAAVCSVWALLAALSPERVTT
ncbi:MAG TPA: hypothetical protein VFB19_20255 [Mycobacterium sp.]|nr:hypothetical protein [Mycobacterium sp.]